MFEWDADAKRWGALHHPFTAPRDRDAAALRADPGNALSQGLRHGAERLGDRRRLGAYPPPGNAVDRVRPARHRAEEAQKKFGFLLEALKFGTPPHGGIAFGLDRIVMFMAGTDSIRDVIAFPKTQSAHCPLTNAPGEVTAEQLKEAGIRLRAAHADST